LYCGVREAVSECCVPRMEASNGPKCGCRHARLRCCDGSQSCHCVQSDHKPAILADSIEVERWQDQQPCAFHDGSAIPVRQSLDDRLVGWIPGLSRPTHPPLIVLFCSWLK
jgi:hypothetical protein